MPTPTHDLADAGRPHAPTVWNFDPELMFVECLRCGRPVIWAPGRATELLCDVGVNRALVDDHCMILTDGCVHCRPESSFFQTRVVRVKGASLGHDLIEQGLMGLA